MIAANRVWPKRLPRTISVPRTNLAHNLATSAARYPDKAAIVYYDTPISYARLWRDVEALAGWLQQRAGVAAGDRVVLYMQNSPAFVTAYYAILRANAIVVPLNPMNVAGELAHYLDDCGARVALAGQELVERILPHLGTKLDQLVVEAYGRILTQPTDFTLPPAVAAKPVAIDAPGVTLLRDALAEALVPGPMTAGADDLAVMPYTSGTTGAAKGCAHTHASVQTTTWSVLGWGRVTSGAMIVSTLPFFHVTGMTLDMNAPIAAGATVVQLTRWDPAATLEAIRRYRVTNWTAIVTMVVDLLAHPATDAESLASLIHVTGGGAALPAAVSDRLFALTGLRYCEGYGLSETISMTHSNPPDLAKPQCLGIPVFGVDSRVIDPETLRELGPGEVGEIIIAGEQLMREYWGRPDATREAFVEIDGKRFLRTGDLGSYDEDGYFFMVDRLKRMINAAGFKVWPAEVEAQLFAHPGVQEACVIATLDPRRGEMPKALIVKRAGAEIDAESVIAFARERMAAYKVPAVVEFVDALPRSGSGKVQWRELQDAEIRVRQLIAAAND